MVIGDFRAQAVAFFADHKQKSDVDFLLAQPLRCRNLGCNDSFGIAGTATVDFMFVL